LNSPEKLCVETPVPNFIEIRLVVSDMTRGWTDKIQYLYLCF